MPAGESKMSLREAAGYLRQLADLFRHTWSPEGRAKGRMRRTVLDPL